MAALFNEESEKKSKQKVLSFSERSLFPVLKANILLSSPLHETLIGDIKSEVAAPTKHFHRLYRKLIDSFAEFVQVLPAANDGRLGGLLNEGIRRGMYMLQSYHERQQEFDTLWNYLLFSAGLLFDVARVIENRTVIISEKTGAYKERWMPHEGSMIDKGKYYRIRRGGGIPAWLSRRLTPILAVDLMPEVGFKWIASNSLALNTWLALLSDESTRAGGYGIMLDKAQELLDKARAEKDFNISPTVNELEPNETALGEDFIEWLRQGIEDGTISVNEENSHVLMLDTGLFLQAPELFQDFTNSRRLAVDWRVVYQQVNALGIAPLSGEDYKFQQYFSDYPEVKASQAAKNGGLVRITEVKPQQVAKTTVGPQAAIPKGRVESTRPGSIFTATSTPTTTPAAVTHGTGVTQLQAETRGIFQTSTHAKIGVLTTSDAVTWLVQNRGIDVSQTQYQKTQLPASEARELFQPIAKILPVEMPAKM